MIQSSNQIALYRKIDEQLIEKAGIKFGELTLSYTQSEGETKYIDLPEEELNFIQINEFDSMWSPSENSLIIEQTLHVDNPSSLFGDEGVADIDSKIGLGVHLHSKTSGFQKTISVGSFPNENDPIQIHFYHEFPPSTIRGVVNLDFFLYLHESHNNNPKFANHSGMILTFEDLNMVELIIDGSGSNFPINEFEEPGGPLWKLEKNWADASEDSFDSSNVNLAFNTKHRLFEEIKKDTRVVNRGLMGNIMIQAMSMIIQQTLIIEENQIEDEDDIMPGSVLAAVAYWVDVFNVDTTSLFSIQNSLLDSLDKQFLEGDKND